MTKAEIINWLISRGNIEYKMGCWAKEKPPIPIPDDFKRYKLNDKVLRYESRASSGWVRLRSAYISKLSVNDKNQLCGLRY